MENSDAEEPDKKRRHIDSVASAMAWSSPTSPDERTIDAAALQCENQKLIQQLDSHKHELHALEGKFKNLKEKQTSYDDKLIIVNRHWNQLVDDLVLLGVRAGRIHDGLKALDHTEQTKGSAASCPSEDKFLYILLESGPTEHSGGNGITKYVQEALSVRRSSTMSLMKYLEDTINYQRAQTEALELSLSGSLSEEDAIIQQHKLDDLMREEIKTLSEAIDILNLKHEEYADEIQTYITSHSTDQLEIKRIAGELDESLAEVEESRRKLINMKIQTSGSSGLHVPVMLTGNGSASPEQSSDKTLGLKELKSRIEEVKELAATRLSELQEAQEDNITLSKQLQDLENELKNDKFVLLSRPYHLLNDLLVHCNAEVDRYKGLIDSFQSDRNYMSRREKELSAKAESADATRTAVSKSETKIEELQIQLQKCIIERNDIEIKLEEAEQDSGKKDIKDEFRVMASALSKEMDMMEAQLNRWKDTAHEALSLREEAYSLKALLSAKTAEHESLSESCAEQMAEIKSLKALIENLQKEKQELQIFLDMHGQECFDKRDLLEIKESERRARAQAEVLKNALDEHSLELRVKAANEAESACQQRLSVAESEILDLRAKLDVSEREVLELTEAIKIKDSEAEAYIAEIETIGQAYEDMQTQHQHLVQQVAERDDYNIKLVSESVKLKQAQSFLLYEKQALAKKLQQVHASVESSKQKISRSDDQMKSYLTEAGKACSEHRHLITTVDTSKWELADAEKELKWLRGAISSSEKEFEQNQRKVTELQRDLDRERIQRKKLDEDLREVNNKVSEMSLERREAAIQILQDEIKDCKAILKCGVCSDRPKEVVITKCYHLFCNTCIQKNLEIRHRKCPACGTAFGQSDVRFVHI
ncbi:E3 ubiquitin-protein ligase BRE1-like 2 [Papaver somniferum]|uniref:E3 ubiquitin-protein ligase BRE1-like 2 n=1 Tax=Papaver somniferum TaxID=3469 RepID=UPI000E6F798C|nr:E3 ubiquitin-protein ligase BRE1-like 2 [Papaver somniferum]